jgi:hypothetical protein
MSVGDRFIEKFSPVGGKNVFEMESGVDVGCHHVSQNARVFGMQHYSTVQYIQEQVNVTRVGEISGHRFKHSCDQAYPHKFVKNVQTKKFFS